MALDMSPAQVCLVRLTVTGAPIGVKRLLQQWSMQHNAKRCARTANMFEAGEVMHSDISHGLT